MTRSSSHAPASTKATLIVEFAGGGKPLNSTPAFNCFDETIRVLLRKHLPHGVKAELAALAGIHPNQLSRQLSGDDGLHNKTVSAAVWIFRRFSELQAVVTAVHLLRDGEVSAELSEKTGLLIEFGTGQLALPGMR